MDVFLGMIAAFGFNYNPRGWAFCSGQTLGIAQNTALFSLLGTTYGGDGRTTFGLPDLRGRTLIGIGNGPGLSPVVQGEMAGNQQVTIGVTNMPQHNHTLSAARLSIANSDPNTNLSRGFLANTPVAQSIYAESSNATSRAIAGTTDIAGGSQPLGIRNPYLGINYCIAIVGIFPSRN